MSNSYNGVKNWTTTIVEMGVTANQAYGVMKNAKLQWNTESDDKVAPELLPDPSTDFT